MNVCINSSYKVIEMASTKILKKDLLLLAQKHGLKATTRMTRGQILALYATRAQKKHLQELAKALGHKPAARITKAQLLSLCLPVKPAQTSSGLMPKAQNNAQAVTPASAKPAPKNAAPQNKEPDVELPWRYNENRLVLMPVNPYRVYGYWELTEIIERDGRKYNTHNCQLVLNLYAANADGGSHRIIKSVNVKPYGEYYFNHNMAGQIVWLEIGLKERGSDCSVSVLHSLKTQMPSDHVSESAGELFLTVMDNYADKRTLVFSGRYEGGEGLGEVFLTDFESFPKFGY